jgi:glutathione S-transferase
MSAFVALHEKRQAVQVTTVDLGGGQQCSEDYRRLSLTSRVPCLEHGSFHLSESSAIAEYLEQLLPPPEYAALYPGDLQHRAKARQVQAWLRSDLMPIRSERPTTVVFDQPLSAPLSDAAKQAAAKLFQAADNLLAHGGEHLFGAWCIADADLALMLNRLRLNGDAVPARLARYAEQQWQRPSIQAWLQFHKKPA